MFARPSVNRSDRAPMVIFVVLALTSALLFGCGSNDNDDQSQQATSAPAVTDTSQSNSAPATETPRSSDQSREVEPVTLGFLESTGISAIAVLAARSGFLEREGLNVELVPYATGAPGIAMVLAGEADFASGMGGAMIAAAITEGACIQVVGVDQRNTLDLGARPDLELPNAGRPYPEPLQDVIGKTVGVPIRGGNAEQQVRVLLRDGGIDPDADVTFVAVGGPATAVPALQQGQIDMVYLVPPMQQVLGENGFQYVARVVGETGHALEDLLNSFTVTSCRMIDDRSDVVERFCTAFDLAGEFAQDPSNTAAMSTFMAELLALDSTAGQEIWEASASTYATPALDKATWEAQAAFLPAGAALPAYEDAVYAPCVNTGE